MVGLVLLNRMCHFSTIILCTESYNFEDENVIIVNHCHVDIDTEPEEPIGFCDQSSPNSHAIRVF